MLLMCESYPRFDDKHINRVVFECSTLIYCDCQNLKFLKLFRDLHLEITVKHMFNNIFIF